MNSSTTPRTHQSANLLLISGKEGTWLCFPEADFKFNIGRAEFSNQTRSPIMIVPAYATAHMSQILIYWTRGENTAFLNRSSKHFRCVPLRFPISILWEFNLIPTDISPGTVFQWRKKKNGNKKIRTDWGRFFFSRSRALGYLGISLSLYVCQSLSLSLSPFLQRLFYLICWGSGRSGHGAEGAFMD